jgi:hypothetical protein
MTDSRGGRLHRNYSTNCFRSVYEVPSNAIDVASALFSLTIALGQVQEVRLDQNFVPLSEEHEVMGLGKCLGGCTELLPFIERKSKQPECIGETLEAISKGWDGVQWSFTQDELAELLAQAEAGKTNLTLILNAFTM